MKFRVHIYIVYLNENMYIYINIYLFGFGNCNIFYLSRVGYMCFFQCISFFFGKRLKVRYKYIYMIKQNKKKLVFL